MAKVTISENVCKGCGLCTTVCPKKIVVLAHDILNAKGYHPARGILTMKPVHWMCNVRDHVSRLCHHSGKVVKQLWLNSVLMKGNEALAEAAITSRMPSLLRLPNYPADRGCRIHGQKNAEDRRQLIYRPSRRLLPSIWCWALLLPGVRVMTSSSSPGISLKTEGISYIAGSDLPCRDYQCAAGRPRVRRHPAFPGRLLAGHPRYRPRRFPYFGICTCPPFRKWWIWCAIAFDKADEYRMPCHDSGRRHAGPDDGAGGISGNRRRIIRLKSPGRPQAIKGKRTPQYHQFPLPGSQRAGTKSCGALLSVTQSSRKRSRWPRNTWRRMQKLCWSASGATARIARSAVNSRPCRWALRLALIRPITLWPFPEKDNPAKPPKLLIAF